MPATELSGFGLDDDMSDTLVVAISQSGTTTDTNRTVDLVRARGAAVVAIVNRRNSDLVEKADGVLYTSDGRDVEMSVASTKAFYAQVAAGFLLAAGHRRGGGGAPTRRADARPPAPACGTCPPPWRRSSPPGPRSPRPPGSYAPRRRYWAVVGNGPNRVAASELRIKLSELCYKSIACDATEDKKHIDLSSEPLILVCAAGPRPARTPTTSPRRSRSTGPTRRRRSSSPPRARRSPPRWPTIRCPRCIPASPSCCRPWPATSSATRRRWPSTPRPGRCARRGPPSKDVVGDGDGPPERPAGAARAPASSRRRAALPRRPAGRRLQRRTWRRARRCGWRRCCATPPGRCPLEVYELDYGRVGTPGVVVEDLTDALTRGHRRADPPGRRHQAPGQDGHRGHLPVGGGAVRVAAGGASAGRRRAARPAELPGAARPGRPRPGGRGGHRLHPLPHRGRRAPSSTATIQVVDEGGVAAGLRSRAEPRPDVLRGTKHRAAIVQEVTVARGGADGRTVVLVPRSKDGAVGGHHPAPRPVRRPPPGRRHARRARGLPGPLRRPGRRRHRDRARASTTTASARCRSSTC